MSGSKNYFQWRVKRPAKTGNCTIRISTDGNSFSPLTPMGKKSWTFECGRKSGYEAVEYRLPAKVVSGDKMAIVQLEFETDMGTIVQCADAIVQKFHEFKMQKCDPACKNGGVCSNGVCKCGKMFTGVACEIKIEASGSFSLLLFIFAIALVILGIYVRNQTVQI